MYILLKTCKGSDDWGHSFSLHAVPRKAASPVSLLEHCLSTHLSFFNMFLLLLMNIAIEVS